MRAGLLTMAAATFAAALPCQAADQVRMTVIYLPEDDLAPGDLAQVTRIVNRTFQQNARLDVQDSDSLLAKFGGDVPRTMTRSAEQAAASGVEALTAGRAEDAVPTLQRALDDMISILPFIKKRLLARTMLALAIAHAETGNERAARATLLRLFTWRPRFRYDVNVFPAQHVGMVEEVRRKLRRLKRGSIEITTEPAGARAFVDGRYVGVTPAVAFGLPVGEHFVTVKKAGYIKGGQAATVSPRQQMSYSVPLKRSEKFLLLQQSLAAASVELGEPKAGSAILDVGRILFVQQIVFVRVAPTPGPELAIRAFLYDIRSRLRLNQVTMQVDTKRWEALERLAPMVYTDVRYDGLLEAPAEPERRAAGRQRASGPIYKRWWFWTAIAAGLAAGATAIAVPLTMHDPGCPAPCVTIQN